MITLSHQTILVITRFFCQCAIKGIPQLLHKCCANMTNQGLIRNQLKHVLKKTICLSKNDE